MNQIEEIATRIIKEQELIMGPIAWTEAGKVNGLRILDTKNGTVSIDGQDPKRVIDTLVGQYERLFGRAAREGCREAVVSLIAELPPSEIPSSLLSA